MYAHTHTCTHTHTHTHTHTCNVRQSVGTKEGAKDGERAKGSHLCFVYLSVGDET